MLARGLVVRLDAAGARLARRVLPQVRSMPVDDVAEMLDGAIVEGRGFRKFFTVEAAASDWGRIRLVDDDEHVTVGEHVSIPLEAPASVSDKLDGALGVGTVVDGRLRLNTKGSFRSDEALAGTRLLDRHDPTALGRLFGGDGSLAGFTPLFEIITRDVLHVIRYPYEDVVFLGLEHIRSGRWIPATLLANDPLTTGTDAASIPSRYGFRTPTVYTAPTLEAALTRPELAGHEGMVATIDRAGRQDMFKIKYPTFLLLQRFKDSMTDRTIRTLVNSMPAHDILAGTPPDPLTSLPEHVRDKARPIADMIAEDAATRYVRPVAALARHATAVYAVLAAGLDVSTRDGAKTFATRVNDAGLDRRVRSVLFAMRKTDDAHRLEAAVDAAKRMVLR